MDPDRPFNDLPTLPPAVDVETKPVLRACAEARQLLGELKQNAKQLPDETVLINTLPMLEAQASSEIENIVTTTDKLFRYMDWGEALADPATKEALRYRQALKQGCESIAMRPLSTATAEAICSSITGVEMRVRKVPGTHLSNPATGERIYTPPEGETLLRDLLADWERYIHQADTEPGQRVEPLVRLAVQHYQFEAIHPFTDGNGRTGRILNLLFLLQEEILDTPVLYLSGFIIRERAAYYRLPQAVRTDEAWEEWVLYILQGLTETARWTLDKIAAIRALMAETRAEMRTKVPKIDSHELLQAIFSQPYCRIENLVDAGIAKRQTASEYLKQLVAIGLLREKKVGRQKLFVNERFLKVLTGGSARVVPPA